MSLTALERVREWSRLVCIQHAAAVEDFVARHLLWSPRRTMVAQRGAALQDLVELSDGRAVTITTSLIEIDGTISAKTVAHHGTPE